MRAPPPYGKLKFIKYIVKLSQICIGPPPPSLTNTCIYPSDPGLPLLGKFLWIRACNLFWQTWSIIFLRWWVGVDFRSSFKKPDQPTLKKKEGKKKQLQTSNFCEGLGFCSVWHVSRFEIFFILRCLKSWGEGAVWKVVEGWIFFF